MSSGVVIAVVGSTAVVVVRAVVVVGRLVVERLVAGAVTSRRYIWYQSEMEEKGNHTNICGMCPFNFISAALTWFTELNHCNAHESWVSYLYSWPFQSALHTWVKIVFLNDK